MQILSDNFKPCQLRKSVIDERKLKLLDSRFFLDFFIDIIIIFFDSENLEGTKTHCLAKTICNGEIL